MKKIFSICFSILFSLTLQTNAQTSFLGFDQEQCGLIENHGYTFDNLTSQCYSHTANYKVFLNGKLTYEKPCLNYTFDYVVALFFINDSTGFLIEKNSGSNHSVLKTKDYGKSWSYLNGGGPTYWGFYLINEYNLYLITGANGTGPLITRASNIDSKSPPEYSKFFTTQNEIMIKDTIYGNSFCNLDKLSFRVKEGASTISYIFVLKNEPLTTVNQIKSATQLELYPNPADDFINLVSARLGKSHIRISNSSGRTIKEFDDYDFKRLYIGDLKKGLYLIELNSDNNIQIGKFLKE